MLFKCRECNARYWTIGGKADCRARHEKHRIESELRRMRWLNDAPLRATQARVAELERAASPAEKLHARRAESDAAYVPWPFPVGLITSDGRERAFAEETSYPRVESGGGDGGGSGASGSWDSNSSSSDSSPSSGGAP